MNNEIKTQLCQEDFYLMMRNAVIQAGGADRLEDWKRMKFEDVVDMFAKNGIRMIYMPEKHMDAIKIVWENPKPVVKFDLPPAHALTDNGESAPIKRRQLLCDAYDNMEEDDVV